MYLGCFAGFVLDSDKLLLMSASLLLAIVLLLALRKRGLSTKLKLAVIYAHLTALFFPFVVLGTDLACGMACMPCANNLAALAALSLPTALLLSAAAGFFIIPGFFLLFNRKAEMENMKIIKFVERFSAKLCIRMPKLYIIDSAKPLAFSLRSFRAMIFVSAGLVDLLAKKEMEAIVLHELAHIRQKASVLKLSASLLRFFSPLSLLAGFRCDHGEEEVVADKFAAQIQGTGRYINSAKQKMDKFERELKIEVSFEHDQ